MAKFPNRRGPIAPETADPGSKLIIVLGATTAGTAQHSAVSEGMSYSGVGVMMDELMVTGNTLNCTEQEDFVEVMFARSPQEARDCVRFLVEQAIPSRIEDGNGLLTDSGVAVLVPSDRMMEATELLAAMVQGDGEGDEPEDEEADDELDDDFDDDKEDDFDDDDDDELDDDDEEEEEEEADDDV